jgi:hypothetical protein
MRLSEVARMVAVPTETPVTTPVFALTVATELLVELHVTVRPVRTSPSASRVVAVPADVPPTVIDAGESDAETEATGVTVTVRFARPVTLPLEPTIVALPAARPVMIPLEAPTFAMEGALELQVTGPDTTWLLASRRVATAVVVAPDWMFEEPSDTCTAETDPAEVTVIVAWSVTPSLVAKIVAVPAETPVTMPVRALTVATAALFEVNETTRPVMMLLPASRSVAEASVVAPAAIDEDPSVSETVATGTAFTDTLAWPVIPSTVAMMLADPPDTPVMTPVVGLTTATPVLLELHATTFPARMLLAASRAVAVAVVVAPVLMVPEPSATVTDAAGTPVVTVTGADPVMPSLVAKMVAVPGLTPVTTPVVALTVATPVLPELKLTTRPARMLFPVSRIVAVAVVVEPTCTADGATATDTDATGTAVTLKVTEALNAPLVAVMIAVPVAAAVT